MSHQPLQEQVRAAIAGGQRLRIVGSGSRPWLHPALPDGVDCVPLDCSGLGSIRWIDREDRTCCVEAGVRLDELAAALHEFDLGLPFWDGCAATVGGAFLGGTPSLCTSSWGHARDQVLGGEWILANGEFVRTGSRVVKSVAGYDLTRLFVGSRGQLAACTALILRLRPRPRQWAVAQHARRADRGESDTPWMAIQHGVSRWTAWPDPLAAPLGTECVVIEDDEFQRDYLQPLALALQPVRAWSAMATDGAESDHACVREWRSGLQGWMEHAAPDWPPQPSPWLQAVQRGIAPEALPFV